MNFYLKILNETKHRQALKVDGNSGRLYIFKWSEAIRAYCYQPKNQEEVDDLFRTMGRTTGYLFAPVEVKGSNPAAEAAAAPIAKPLAAQLAEHCEARGISVAPGDTDEIARRLIAAYDKGVNSALLAKPRKNAKPEPAVA